MFMENMTFLIFLFVIILILIVIIFYVYNSKKELDKAMAVNQERIALLKEKLNLKDLEVDQLKSQTNSKIKELESQQDEVQLKKQKLEDSIKKEEEILLDITGFTKEEAQERLLCLLESSLDKQKSKILKLHKEEIYLNKNQIAQDILIGAMEGIVDNISSENNTYTIEFENDDLKGKIIGKDGRNIRSIENILGINIIINDTPGVLQVSSFNPIRREVGYRVLSKLVETGKINQTIIEKTSAKMQSSVDDIIIEKGNDAINRLGIMNISTDLIYELGSLHFRSSFKQNVLEHSIESAKLAANIANELGLDPIIAKRAALLHDIGKVVSEESNLSHTELGYKIAKENGEDDIVLNAILSHHNEVEPDNVYSSIVQFADSLSASRPGARGNTSEYFYKRVAQLEELAQELDHISGAYVLQGGKELRVVVSTDDDVNLQDIGHKLQSKISEEITFPGTITVNVIKEDRFSIEVTKNNGEDDE